MCPSHIAQTKESYLISEEALVSSYTAAAASGPGEAVSERHRIAMASVYRTWLRKSTEHGCGRADVSLAPSLALWLSETDTIYQRGKMATLKFLLDSKRQVSLFCFKCIGESTEVLLFMRNSGYEMLNM